MNSQVYHFADVEVDASQLCVRKNGLERRLRQKSFQVLAYLLEHRERLVTKDELIEHTWRAIAVTDNALEQCMAEIRKALGDDSRNPRFIKTVPRAGYRFIGTVEEVNVEQSIPAPTMATGDKNRESIKSVSDVRERTVHLRRSRRWFKQLLIAIAISAIAVAAFYLVRKRSTPESLVSMTLGSDPGKRPVAVMFFDNQSGSEELDWLREGLADMIITDLSRSKNIAVLSRQQLSLHLNRAGHKATDPIQLEEAVDIARRSHTQIVMLGSFARLGEQIRIDVHIHDGRDGQLLTAERVVVDNPAQILTQVDLLSLKLASYIGAPNGDAKTNLSTVSTNNLEAYRYYSLGVEKAQVMRNDEAVSLLQKATTLDRNFAMAYARIGYVYAVRGNSAEKAKPFLEKGYQLSDRLTEKDKLDIAAWYAIANFDFPTAINSFRQMVSNYPLEVEAYWHLATLLRGEERIEEGLEIAKQGLAVDPGEKELYNYIGLAYSNLGRHDEAIAMFRRYIELAPNEPNAYDSLGLGLQWSGRYPEAISEYEHALAIKPDFEIAMVHLGNVYFQQGHYREAIKQYQRYMHSAKSDDERARGWYSIAIVNLRAGKLAQAEQAAQQHIKHNKNGGESLFLVALERGDLAAAEKSLQMIDARQILARGARAFMREQIVFRGYFELKSGKSEQAIKSLKEALRHLPMSWNIDPFEDCLANAYLLMGRWDEAISEYERILRLNPDYPLVHYHLAQAYDGKSQPDQARIEYERFRQVWKDADDDIPEVVSARKALSH